MYKKYIKLINILLFLNIFLIILLVIDAYIYKISFMSSYKFQYFVTPFIWGSFLILFSIKEYLQKKIKIKK